MSRKGLPVFTLSIILILVLALSGVAYGLWSENLVIDGTVQTGEVDVGFSTVFPIDWVGPAADVTSAEQAQKLSVCGEGQEFAGTNCVPKHCTVEAYDYDPNSDGKEGLTIKVTNAYPSYHCAVFFNVDNYGTVPVLVYKPVANTGNPAWVKVDGCYHDGALVNPNGHTEFCGILIHFTNADGVKENSTYTFGFTIEARQWNEPR